MTPPTLISTSVSTNFGNTTPSKNTAVVSWNTGDLLTCWGFTGDSAVALTDPPTATGLTFTRVLSSVTASRIHLYAWTATAGSGGSSAVAGSTISVSQEGGYVVRVWRGASGFSPISSLGSGTTNAATVSYTLAGTDSAIDGGWGNWNQNTGARTYLTTNLGTATEDSYYTSGTFATVGTWHNAQTTATGAQTIGMSAPNPLDAWLIAGIEILGGGVVEEVPNIDMGGYGPAGMEG